jgi:hypothetical protein
MVQRTSQCDWAHQSRHYRGCSFSPTIAAYWGRFPAYNLKINFPDIAKLFALAEVWGGNVGASSK